MDICKTCGGDISRSGNYYVCSYCGNKWEIDSSNDIHAVDRANAWSALREGDFEKSTELFEHILSKEASNHEAYWGRALALNGIVYVTDLNENKKVPTCNNITENSFIDHKDVQKALSLAPTDIADSYRAQAEYIETVRVEWMEKASKEPAYDVFISFKDSDRENGIARTQDSIDAQDLYNALIAEGYKVFFSRISLRDKVSEQYEPYIYNAIKTAKVMIVFGEKAEYFSSVWIKNEWSRFRARIEKGEKHRNSLVVVYKNMNPGDLPAVLKARQCLNAADMTFLSDLTRHIKRVVDESRKTVQLEKIQIAGGQIAKKAAALSINAVQTREIGMGAIAKTSITEKQSLSLIRTYLEERQWQEAATLADDVLFNNPSCAEAIWCRLMAQHQFSSNKTLSTKLDCFTDADYGYIEKILNCCSKQFAEELLLLMYASEQVLSDSSYKRVLTAILPFAFDKRDAVIHTAFDSVIAHTKFDSFQLLLSTLDSADVDRYVDYYYRYAKSTMDPKRKLQCLQTILDVDAGHVDALRQMVLIDLQQSKAAKDVIPDFETLLKYTPDVAKEVITCLDWLCDHMGSPCLNHCEFARQLIRYYPGEISELKENLINLSYQMIEKKQYDHAEYFLNLVLSFDANNADVYWGICMMRVGVSDEKQIVNAEHLLRDVPEFNRYLTLVDDARRKQCISISKAQKDRRCQQIQEKITKRRKKIEELQSNTSTLITERDTGTLWRGILMLAVCIILMPFILYFGAAILDAPQLTCVLFLVDMFACLVAYAIIKTVPSKSQIKDSQNKKKSYEASIRQLQEELTVLKRDLSNILSA